MEALSKYTLLFKTKDQFITKAKLTYSFILKGAFLFAQ